jgi:co-chaperonin GroES (HSP10)
MIAVERIEDEQKSQSLFTGFDSAKRIKRKTEMKALVVPERLGFPFKAGDHVFVKKYSDYETNFSYKGKDISVIRILIDDIEGYTLK